MITINSLRIDTTGENILIDAVTDVGNVFTQLLLWNEDTYNDPAQAIDLSALIDGTDETETITINGTTDLQTQYLRGVWFVQLTSDSATENVQLGVAANLYDLYECILRRLATINIDECRPVQEDGCGECEGNVFYMDLLLNNIGKMLEFGFYAEAAKTVKELEELCEICPTCPDFENPVIANGSGYATANNIVVPI